MKKIILSLFLIFSFVAICISQDVANAKGKPLVLYVYQTHCGACQQFEPIFEAAKSKYSQKFDFVKEDYNNSQRAKSLNVTETPSVFINSQKIDSQCLNQQGCFEQKLKNY